MYPVVDTSDIMDLRGDIAEESRRPTVVEDNLYVAVGKDLKDSRLTLQWAIENRGGSTICILHVHQPADKVPFVGIMYTQQVSTYHKTKRQAMLQLLEKYNQICQKAGVVVEVHYIEKGIVEFIVKNNVKRLVMGAAADKHFSKKMVNLRSKKAIYVRLHAAACCQIHFVCKGNVISTRPGRLDGLGDSSSSSPLLPHTNSDSGQNSLMPRPAREGPTTRLQTNIPTQEYLVMSENHGSRISTSSLDSSVKSTPVGLSLGRISDEWSGFLKRSLSTSSRVSTCSTEVVDDSASITYTINEGSEIESEYGAMPFKEHVQNPSAPSAPERGINDELYDQLEQAMVEAESSKRDAFEESTRRRKAEKDAIESKRRVKVSENLYNEELRQRREIAETLEKAKEEHESTKKELNEVSEKLRMELEQKSFLESQIAEFDHTVLELEQKMFSAIEMLQNYKKERDELQVKCDGALKLVEELREKQEKEVSSLNVSRFYTEFDFLEVRDATRNFDPFLKIGEGAYGSTFRGFLRHTEVTVKMLYAHSLQGPTEFQQEVNVLCKLRHPNLVTVIGACPDARIIIYEHLSGGNLEDRLNCKDKTPPLSWQDRIRIAAELCSVLNFLHSCGIVHGDLKPNKILIDKNMVTKLSDFGNHHALSQNEVSGNNTTLSFQTDTKSDTYSFGIILLRLLTGRDSSGLIIEEVQNALDENKLKDILDLTAGNWPFVQAQQLATLAMNCCDVVSKKRPDLAFEVWRVLEPMRISCGLSSSRSSYEGQHQIPPYFICPISQETMQDPVVAADGFTYEAEVLKGWLDSGHNISPMTNLKLANTNLVPNHALRSAIQEWIQQP